MEIINFKKIKKEVINNENEKICCICKEKFEIDMWNIKEYRKVRDHCHYTEKYRGAYNLK